MITRGTTRPRSLEHSEGPARLGASEILFGIAYARAAKARAVARLRYAWLAAILMAALVCWRITADGFALSRHTDELVTRLVKQMASQNGVINHAIYIASETTVLTGGLLIAMVWYCWFNTKANAGRERLLLGFGGVLAAAVLSRLLQVSLPMRARPLHDLASGFLPLPGIDAELANHWGSFPSDHAALFFALVTVIWRRSPWLGLAALLSAVYGVLPRIYFGLHYLSDVAGGAALGVALVLMFERFGPRALAHRGIGWELRLPGIFYGSAFLLSLEVATLFEDIRQAGRGIPSVLKQFGI